MKPLHYFFIAAALMVAGNINAQVAINTSGASPDASAILDLSNTANKGLLIPAVSDTSSVGSPAAGLLIYRTTAPAGYFYYTGNYWQRVISSGSTLNSDINNLNLNALLPAQSTPYTYLSSDGTNTSFSQIDIQNGGVINILPVVNGGTGVSDGTNILPDQSTSSGYFLTTDGVNPAWIAIAPGGVNSVSATSPLSNTNTPSDPVIALTGIVPVTSGGTGTNSFTVGDILYANTTSSLNTLSDVATGNALISGGVNTAPSYGKIDLTTHITGVLPVANGGTNTSTALSGSSIMISDGTSLIQGALGTSTTLLHGNVSGAPTYSAVDLANDITGTLPISSGGTNSTTALSGSSLMVSNGAGIVQGSAGTATQVLHGNASGTPTYSAIALATDVSGTLPVASGGTNSGTALSGSSIMVSNGTGIVQGLAGIATQVLHGNASGTPTYSAIALATDVSGTLPIGNGGTNSGISLSGSSIMVSNGTGIVQGLAGIATQVLHGNSSGTPTYSAIALATDVSGSLPVVNGGTGQTSYTDGQLLIGKSTGTTLNLGTLTTTSNIVKIGYNTPNITIDLNVANVYLTSNVAQTVVLVPIGFIDVTGMSFSVGASETWSFEFNLQNGCSGAGGLQYALTFPSATLRATVVGMGTGTAVLASSVITASGGASGTLNSVVSAAGWTRICGSITTTAGGTVLLRFQGMVNTQTSTVYANSYLTARRSN
jgi:hypothetical protein